MPYSATLISPKLDFYWFTTDQWDFEARRPRIRDHRPSKIRGDPFPKNSIPIGHHVINENRTSRLPGWSLWSPQGPQICDRRSPGNRQGSMGFSPAGVLLTSANKHKKMFSLGPPFSRGNKVGNGNYFCTPLYNKSFKKS